MLVQVLSVFLDSSFAMALDLKNVSVLDLRSRLAETAREAADRFPGVFDGRFYRGTDRLIANASDDFLEGRPFEDLRKILLVQFFLQSRMERALREGQKQVFLKLFSKGPQIGMALVYAASCGVQPESAMRALQSLLPGTQEVRNSFYLWHHPELSYVYCYREVCKIRGQEVGRKDLKAIERELREQLLLVPSLTPGLFWPYNKEDAYRQIQLLQREIKRNEDLPHVSVHFREQTASSLEFLIYLVRPKFAEPLDQVFKCLPDSLPFFCRCQYENRVPTPVQAGVFSVKLPSAAFEVCGSINLLYARRYLLKFLEAAVGPFRDYNGGLFEMQQQHFEAIRVTLLVAGLPVTLFSSLWKKKSPFSTCQTMPHLVARTTLSRRPAMALPTICSERPKPYIGAVSTSVMPASMAARIASVASFSCVPPHIQPPMAHVPSPTTEALIPDAPSGRYCIA